MRAPALALALLLLATASPAIAREHDDDDRPGSPAVIDREDVVEQIQAVDALIYEAMRARGKPASTRALDRARERLQAVRNQVSGAPGPREWLRAERDPRAHGGPVAEGPTYAPPPAAPPRPPAPPPVQPISEGALGQLVATIDRQPTSAGRLAVLQRAASSEYFLVTQVQVLVGRFAFPPDQVQAARLLQPRVLDRENERQLDRWLRAPPGPYAGLVERASFEAMSSVRLQPGVYRGTFTVAGSSLVIEGAGRDQTVIDGDLVINNAFNTVKSLTVLGRVVIRGSQNRLGDVDYRGGVEDKGMMNKY